MIGTIFQGQYIKTNSNKQKIANTIAIQIYKYFIHNYSNESLWSMY